MIRDSRLLGLGLMIVVWVEFPVAIRAADLAGSGAVASPATEPQSPQVPPLASGVFSSQKRGTMKFHLSVTGHAFTSRDAIEKYIAYRAAELAMSEHASWFTLVETRAKSDMAPLPKTDPAGPRFSFRMEYWRPVWRYKTGESAAWTSWSPFSGTNFFTGDPITTYEASADIVLHKGMMASDNPLAFDAGALSGFLVNQVSPPQ